MPKKVFQIIIAIYIFIVLECSQVKGVNIVAKKILKELVKQGYQYIDTIYDDDFIYDVFENQLGQRKVFIIGVR